MAGGVREGGELGYLAGLVVRCALFLLLGRHVLLLRKVEIGAVGLVFVVSLLIAPDFLIGLVWKGNKSTAFTRQ